MWLRDSLASSSNGVRVLLYGYDTSLVGTESFQDIEDIGNKLGDFINPIRPRMVCLRTDSAVNRMLSQSRVKVASSRDRSCLSPIASAA